MWKGRKTSDSQSKSWTVESAYSEHGYIKFLPVAKLYSGTDFFPCFNITIKMNPAYDKSVPSHQPLRYGGVHWLITMIFDIIIPYGKPLDDPFIKIRLNNILCDTSNWNTLASGIVPEVASPAGFLSPACRKHLIYSRGLWNHWSYILPLGKEKEGCFLRGRRFCKSPIRISINNDHLDKKIDGPLLWGTYQVVKDFSGCLQIGKNALEFWPRHPFAHITSPYLWSMIIETLAGHLSVIDHKSWTWCCKLYRPEYTNIWLVVSVRPYTLYETGYDQVIKAYFPVSVLLSDDRSFVPGHREAIFGFLCKCRLLEWITWRHPGAAFLMKYILPYPRSDLF